MNPLTGPPPDPVEPLVEVIPIGPVDETACAVIAAHLEALMGLPARIRFPWPLPAEALLPARQQYDAGPILKAMGLELPLFRVRLGVTVLDLCLPFLS